MSVNISRFDNELVISFDYSPSRVVKIKSISGYKWNPEKKFGQFHTLMKICYS